MMNGTILHMKKFNAYKFSRPLSNLVHHIALACDCLALSLYLTDVVQDDPQLNGDKFPTIEQRLIVMVVICLVRLL